MFELAIKARMPVIEATTSDLMNVLDVVSFYANGSKVVDANSVLGKNAVKAAPEGSIVVSVAADTVVSRNQYEYNVESDVVWLSVNPELPEPYGFRVGEIPTPRALMLSELEQVVGDAAKSFVGLFSGLTLKQMVEVVRMCQAQYGGLSAQGVMALRAAMIGKLQGLSQVVGGDEFYLPPEELTSWLAVNKPYFGPDVDVRLVPRGLLLNGEPGVGKTMASKYLARELNVPLYRLDISSALSKWNGDSEQNLQRALATVDAEAPCVLLIDEIEKLFAVARDDGAINQRLLAQTLWWLQEHRTPVLTIMTTNDMDALPSELHRAGRIDETITIEKLDQVGAFALAKKTLDRFVKPSTDQVHQLRSAVTSGLSKKDKRIAHADVVGLVIALVKRQQWVPIPTSKKEKGSS